MAFSGPTVRDLQDGAHRLGLPPLSTDIATTIRAALDKSVAAMQQLDAMPDPVMPGADMSPRPPGLAALKAAAILRGEQPANDGGGGGVVIDLERYAQLAQVAR